MPPVVPRKPPFAPKKVVSLREFSLGLNDKFSSLLIDAKEVQAIQNFNFDEKGALTKRKGYTAHYASTFAAGSARDMTNYRKQDGTSRNIIAADDKLFYDNPQFIRLYTLEADWETVGVQMSGVNSVQTAGDIVLNSQPGMLGQFLLGAVSALLGGPASSTRSGTWQSEPVNITAVSSKSSGVAAIVQTLPSGSTITVQTRTSADGSTGWSAYVGLGASNTVVSAANNYLQFLVTMTATGGSPSVQSLQVTFDTTATVSTLTTGLSTLARYTFATQNDVLYIVNGVDTNREWDGTTFAVQGGTPPSAKYVTVHKNIMFIAGNSVNPSRLYFSALADPETWPALNFIDVAKGDGDQITGLAVLLDRLVITKQNSVHLLEGDASSNFILRRVTDEAGCVDMHSIVVVKNTLGMLARDGFYFFDGVRMVLASEKIQTTFQALNNSQFGLVAAAYFPSIRKVLIAIPNTGALANNVVLIYDTLRTAWTVYTGINAASWVIWRQFNTDHLLFGDATTGQVYDAETGHSDNGVAIAASVTLKALDLGGSEIAKFLTEVLIDAKETSGTGDATVNVSFLQDLSTTESAATAVTVTGASVNVKRIIPSSVGVGTVRDVAIKIAETSSTRGLTLLGIALSYTPKLGLRST